MSGLTPEQMIQHMFNDADEGLIPLIESEIGQNFQRFQIRPWAFNGIDVGSGYRVVRAYRRQTPNTVNAQLDLTIRIGHLLTITDESTAVIEALTLLLALDRTIIRWSKSSRIVQALGDIDGAPDQRQDKDINSGDYQAWYSVVAREFNVSIEFYDG